MHDRGEVAEWSMAAVSKTVGALCVPVGSNPTLSAILFLCLIASPTYVPSQRIMMPSLRRVD
jgi:hypothetical protein